MTETKAHIHCTVVTPEAQVMDIKAIDVILPAHDGLFGVQTGHAPLLCNLGTGLLRVQDSVKKFHRIYIEGGFGHVCENEVTVLTRRAITANDITIADAEEQLLKAQILPTNTIDEVETRVAAIQRAKSLVTLTKQEQ